MLFTKGPWTLQKDAAKQEIIISGETRGWGFDHLFSCTDVPELAANAQLAHASPEMYEACIAAATLIGQVIDDRVIRGLNHDDETKVLDLLVLAIIKASGATWSK